MVLGSGIPNGIPGIVTWGGERATSTLGQPRITPAGGVGRLPAALAIGAAGDQARKSGNSGRRWGSRRSGDEDGWSRRRTGGVDCRCTGNRRTRIRDATATSGSRNAAQPPAECRAWRPELQPPHPVPAAPGVGTPGTPPPAGTPGTAAPGAGGVTTELRQRHRAPRRPASERRQAATGGNTGTAAPGVGTPASRHRRGCWELLPAETATGNTGTAGRPGIAAAGASRPAAACAIASAGTRQPGWEDAGAASATGAPAAAPATTNASTGSPAPQQLGQPGGIGHDSRRVRERRRWGAAGRRHPPRARPRRWDRHSRSGRRNHPPGGTCRQPETAAGGVTMPSSPLAPAHWAPRSAGVTTTTTSTG